MSKLIEILGKITDIVWLSILWIAFSVPIFTIGASTTALYHTVTKSFLGNRGYITKEFARAFRINFKQSTLVWMIEMSIFVSLVISFVLMKAFVTDNIYNILIAILFYLLVMMAMIFNCLFPAIAKFEATMKQIFKNCFVLIVAHLPWSILGLGILVVTIIIIYLSPITIVFMPTIYMIGESKIYEHIFKKYIKENE